MKTSEELIKSLKIGDTFYCVSYNSINISDITPQKVTELSFNFINAFKRSAIDPR